MEIANLQPMSIGQILDRTFKIYKNNFIRFIVIVAIIQVPIGLFMTVFSSLLMTETMAYKNSRNKPIEVSIDKNSSEKIDTHRTMRVPSRRKPNLIILAIAFGGMIVTILFSIVAFQLCQGALIKSVSEHYLGNQITVGESYRYVLPKVFTIIAAVILIGLCVFFGILMLVVPGIIFGLWFALTIPVIVIENLDPIKAMSRSRKLVAGNLGKVFVIGFLVMVITWIISIPMAIVGKVINGVLSSTSIYLGIFVEQLFSIVSGIIAMPISSTAFILLYYDLRIRKEGFDLEILAQNMELQTNDS